MTRRCEIAKRVGFVVACPPGGCRLAKELGEPLADDSAEPCVVERIAGPRAAPIVLWTLEALRREIESARPAVLHAPLRREERLHRAARFVDDREAADFDDDHIATDRALPGEG